MDTNNGYEQVYNVREDETLLSRVALVVCVLVPRGVFAAGFSIGKELLTIHYSGYSMDKPVWELDFFEQIFNGEPLLAVKEKVKGVFVCTEKTLVVPDELYNKQDAEKWLRKVYFVEGSDVVMRQHLEADVANYIQAIPINISELIKINFKKAALLPLAAYQFGDKQVQSLFLQCCISNEQVTATLHNYSQLLWHKVFEYSCAEDIAYSIKLLCAENYIDASKLNLACNILAGSEYEVVNELTQYFPGLKKGDGLTIHERWDPAISLANQLLSCV